MAEYFKLKEFFLTRSEKKYLVDLLNSQNTADSKTLALKIEAIGTF